MINTDVPQKKPQQEISRRGFYSIYRCAWVSLMAGMKLCKCTTHDRGVVRLHSFLKVLYRFGKLKFIE